LVHLGFPAPRQHQHQDHIDQLVVIVFIIIARGLKAKRDKEKEDNL
jgi:hypothetical protein